MLLDLGTLTQRNRYSRKIFEPKNYKIRYSVKECSMKLHI